MSEDLEQEVDSGAGGNTSTAETQAKTTEKLFTQAQVNEVVKNRVAEEKRRSAKDLEQIQEDVKSKGELIAKYEEVLSKTIEAQIAELPEVEQKILKKLPLLEQMEILNGDEMKVSKKKIPATPKAERKEEDFKPSTVEKVI